MRRLIPVVLCSIAFAAQAGSIGISGPVVDLDKPGALEALQRDNPRHYDAVMKQVEAAQTVQYSENGLRNLGLFRVPEAPIAFGGNVMPSLPAQTRLRIDVEDVTYAITVRITKDPARMVPAK